MTSEQHKMKSVNTAVRKKDAAALVSGMPVYTDDIAPRDCLIIKILRSPHAYALISEINTDAAQMVDGIECILTYKDVPQNRFTMAGQTYPEPSPYDRLILDRRLRFVGDAAAIVAGKDEKCVDKALKLIKIKYEILEPILDFHTAKDNPILIHPEDDWRSLVPVGADSKRNLCASDVSGCGNFDEVISSCRHVITRTFHTKANQQAMMETFRTYCCMDVYGRLNVVSSTQVTFHVRRILSNALGIPKSQIRVIKPRIGGGFGAKQTVVTEIYPAIVTLKTGKPSKIIYSRYESQIASSPRHEMEITVTLGADENGKLLAASVYTLSNTGAYGEHGPTTVGLSGHKTIPIYSAHLKAYKFGYDVVYTNEMSAGAFRGYGATQGFFAMESAIDELAEIIGIEPIKMREINMVREGMNMPAYYGEDASSCTLNRCMSRAREMLGWDEKYPCRDMGAGKIRAVGCAMAMQGSGISSIDTASVALKLSDGGFYSLMIGASDMGTGCDTILAQMAADCLDTDIDSIVVYGVDTDTSPYDSGSYASSTTYITGGAVVKTCEAMRRKICVAGAQYLGCEEKNVDFDGKKVYNTFTNEEISLCDIANRSMCAGSNAIYASESHSSSISPPPFMVGMCEIELDTATGEVKVLDYVGVIDCGTVINYNLARIQAEGGIVQGIGMALYEDIQYTDHGKMMNGSFLQYKLPSRLDIGNIRIDFEQSYEQSGPFGAKSIGEIVINTPAPAIANAIYNACGLRFRTLPIKAESIALGIAAKNKAESHL